MTKSQKEWFKFKVKDKEHTIGVVKVAVAALTTISQMTWFPLEPHKRSSEVHGELQVEYWLSTPFTAEVDKASGSASVAEDLTERVSLGAGLKDYFKRSVPSPHQQKRSKEDDFLHMLKRNAQHSSDSELHVTPSQPSMPKGSATPDFRFGSSREHHSPSHNPQGSIFRFSWRTQSPPSGSLVGSQPSLPEEGGRVQNNVPEVTGISPREASLEGGQRITLRGSNLGTNLEDVVKVMVVGMDCTGSVEYVSPGEGRGHCASQCPCVCLVSQWRYFCNEQREGLVSVIHMIKSSLTTRCFDPCIIQGLLQLLVQNRSDHELCSMWITLNSSPCPFQV